MDEEQALLEQLKKVELRERVPLVINWLTMTEARFLERGMETNAVLARVALETLAELIKEVH